MAFCGIPESALKFYHDLAANNTKSWWELNRGIYDSSVRAPITELMSELEAEFGSFKVFRPYRDVRFGKDKTPIKDHQGAVIQVEDGAHAEVAQRGSGKGGQLEIVVQVVSAFQTEQRIGAAVGGEDQAEAGVGIATIAEDQLHAA